MDAYKTILIKRSSVAGKVPDLDMLNVGELALNLTDQKIYTKRLNPDTGAEEIVKLAAGAEAAQAAVLSSAPTSDDKLPYGTLAVDASSGTVYAQLSDDSDNPDWQAVGSGEDTSATIVKDVDPTSDDKYSQGTLWVNSSSYNLFVQLSDDSDNPDWNQLSGSSGTGDPVEHKMFDIYTYTANGGETEIDVSHTQGYIAVYKNGVYMEKDVDYTDNDNDKITFDSALSENDQIVVYIFKLISSYGEVITDTSDPTSDDQKTFGSIWVNVDTNELFLQLSTDASNPDWRSVGGGSSATGDPVEHKMFDIYTYTADGGETELDFTHTQGYLSVFKNGIYLEDGVEYTDNDNDKITFTDALEQDDQIVVYIFKLISSYGEVVTDTSDPTSDDQKSYGAIWVNTSTNELFLQLSTDSSNPNWENVGGGGSGGLNVIWVSDDTDINVNYRVIVETDEKEITVTLPSSPSDNDLLFVADGSSNAQDNPVTISRNGNKINDSDDDLVGDVNGFYVGLVFKNDSWYTFNNVNS